MRSKYGNRKTIVDGYTFDSKAEARRYGELKLLVAAGEISHLRMQPRYMLQEGFTCRGKRVQSIAYIADFQYREDEWTVAEDVKGVRTAVYQIKKKMFIYRYPDIVFREVSARGVRK